MAIASFEELCSSICELAGFSVPSLTRDENGGLAIEFCIDGVAVTLMHEPSRDNARFRVLASFGPLIPGDELAVCRALMDANASLLRHREVGFARQPETGDVVLQLGRSLDDTTPIDLFARMRELASLVRGCRPVDFDRPGSVPSVAQPDCPGSSV